MANTGTGEPIGSLIVCKTSHGAELRGTLSKLTRFAVVFETYNPYSVLRVSEVLSEFRIVLQDRTLYSGKAVIRNLVGAGQTVVCEAALTESSWTDVASHPTTPADGELGREFDAFVREWQKLYKVSPDFKVAVADLQTFLTDMRLWVDQIELRIRSVPDSDRLALEKGVGRKIGEFSTPMLTQMFEKFEHTARQIEPDLAPMHSTFARRMLHPLLLCSPFLYRTFHKPLGYAGDYEMVNMLSRDPLEGSSLFAKVINLWFLQQPPAEAHRNRIDYLKQMLTDATLPALRAGRAARFLNLGCGPALEVQQFLETPLADHTRFVLWDFNQETLDHTRVNLEEVKRRHQRGTALEFARRSVHHVLKESAMSLGRTSGAQYDVVYCAGLFDYLTDATCRRVCNALYNMVAPGGLLVVTNVDKANPRTPTMDHVMEWHLIYRDCRSMIGVRPERASEGDCVLKADTTGVNIFMEVRKPEHA